MSDHAQWLAANKAYLGNYIAWVQLRLERYIARVSTPLAARTPANPSSPARKSTWFSVDPGSPVTPAVTPTVDLSALEENIVQLANELSAAEALSPPPALVTLSRQFGLSRFEQDILLLCAALELDGKTAGLCARAQTGAAKPYATFAMALQVFDEAAWDALWAHRPLRYWRLLEISQPGAEPLVTSALRVDERIVSYLVQPQHVLDDRLQPFVVPMPALQQQAHLLAASQQLLAKNLSHYLRWQPSSTQPRIVIELTGADAQAKRAIAHSALAELGMEPVCLALENLPTQTSELEYVLRLWGRERLLLPVALYLDLHNLDNTHSPILHRLLAGISGIVIIACREPHVDIDGFTLEINKPLTQEQQVAWELVLGRYPFAGQFAGQLAGQFSLDIASIEQIGHGLEATPVDINRTDSKDLAPEALKARIWQACLLKTSPRLDQLAQRLDIKASWSELALPPESFSLLQQITAQVELRMRVYGDWGFEAKMNRGMGLSVLFAGESGTGKTMAAEVIANALNLNLYRIDLSAVVSKYIGETEKNLRRLFDAADDGGAILFFDEADALFGKRSEVKDSHDRYANIEINYLLQRIEAYRGLAILASNMKNSLDQAFMRRLRFIVNFQFPAAPQRADIWRKVFPAQTPVGELDYQHLARFNLTGGSIHNIALNAAFLAAGSASSQVTMPLILDAIRGELRKLDKPVNEAEFRTLHVAGGM